LHKLPYLFYRLQSMSIFYRMCEIASTFRQNMPRFIEVNVRKCEKFVKKALKDAVNFSTGQQYRWHRSRTSFTHGFRFFDVLSA
jgi:hypothetical protein